MKNSQKDINDYERVLIVEGYGDLLFYAELLEFIGLHKQVFIKEFNGYREITRKLDAFLNPQLLAEKKAIGLIVDADLDPAGRIQSVTQAIEKATTRKPQHGTWVEGVQGEAKIGLFVTPDGLRSGEVETLVWESWAEAHRGEPQLDCIETYFRCMSGLGLQSKSVDKGRIAAVWAIHYDDDPRLGPGTRAKVFDVGRPEYQPLIAFLQGLA